MTSPFIQVHIKNGMCEFARDVKHSTYFVLFVHKQSEFMYTRFMPRIQPVRQGTFDIMLMEKVLQACDKIIVVSTYIFFRLRNELDRKYAPSRI